MISEYTDMGVCGPCRMLRRGQMKYVYVHGGRAQLYGLQQDPHEQHDLGGDAAHAPVENSMREELLAGWDPQRVLADVLASQRRRLFIKSATQAAVPVSWDFLVTPADRHRFVRASGAAGAKARARFPFVPPAPG